MIYKILPAVGVVALVASFSTLDTFRGDAHRLSLQLDESKAKLTAAQNKKDGSDEQLKLMMSNYGDISEDKCNELHETISIRRKELAELNEAYKAALNRSVGAQTQNNMMVQELSKKIADLNNSITKLEKEIASMEASLQSAPRVADSPKPAATHPDPMSPENINRIIRARMNLYRRENINLAYFEALYNEEEIALKAPKVLYISPEDKMERAKTIVEHYSPRAEKLLAVGIDKKKKSIQMIITRAFRIAKRGKLHTDDCNTYMKVTYFVEENGKVGSDLSWDGFKEPPKLDKGYVPFPYKGETTVICR